MEENKTESAKKVSSGEDSSATHGYAPFLVQALEREHDLIFKLSSLGDVFARSKAEGRADQIVKRLIDLGA